MPAYSRRVSVVSVSTVLTALAGCAHTPLPPSQQEAYFNCDVKLAQAEANLAAEGVPLHNVGDASITTVPVEVKIPKRGSILVPSSGGDHLVYLRAKYVAATVVARRSDGGVRFTLFIDGRKLNSIAAEQVADKTTRLQLGLLRKSVCGGKLYLE